MAETNSRPGSRAAPRLNSEILDRLPPQSLEAERGVLGSLLLDPQLCDEIALLLRAEDFYADANQRLYRQLFALHDEGKRVDITLLVERLRQSGEYEAIGGAPIWPRLPSRSPMRHNAPHYAEIVRNKAAVRELIHASHGNPSRRLGPGYEPRETAQPGRRADLRRPRPAEQSTASPTSKTC